MQILNCKDCKFILFLYSRGSFIPQQRQISQVSLSNEIRRRFEKQEKDALNAKRNKKTPSLTDTLESIAAKAFLE